VTCPSCGAAMRLEADKEYLVCDYCSGIHYPELNAEGIRVLGEPSPLSCPVCAIPLVHAAAGGQRLLYCTRCHGTLISMGIFMAVVQDMRSRRETAAATTQPLNCKDLDRRINCPKCDRTMETHPYGGGGSVIIDDCENCGLNWLDYGELDRIVRAPDREYTRAARDGRILL
jgi:Zn-finger nucleic acid-binding protein